MTLLVEAPGPFLLVQDQGRAGSMHLGVPPSGALDPDALALARVDAGADRDAGAARALGDAQRAADRPRRPVEGGEEAVAHRLDLVAAVRGELAAGALREVAIDGYEPVRRQIVAIRRRGAVVPEELVEALLSAVSRVELERG